MARRVHAFFRDLTATAVGSIAGAAFLRLPPATGRSNDRWRRSAAGLGRFSLAVMAPVEGISCARLRFRVAIRSITGGGVMTCRGLRGRPFSLASISARKASCERSRCRAGIECPGALLDDRAGDRHHVGIEITRSAAELG